MSKKKIIPFNQNSLVSPQDDCEPIPTVKFIEMVKLSEDGEIISSVMRRPYSQNGGGWVITYTAKVGELVQKVPQGSYLRLFFWIAIHQSNELGGYRCTRQYLSDVLGLDRKSIYRGLEWLKDNFLVNETRVDGQLEFLVNPDYVTVGADKNKRRRLWSSRWEAYWRKKNSDFVVK